MKPFHHAIRPGFRGRILLCRALLVTALVFAFSACNNETAKSPGEEAPPPPKPRGFTNKEVYEAINSGDLNRLDSILAKDGIDHGPWGVTHGLDSIKLGLTAFRNAFPDVKIEATDEAVDGDMIYTRFHMTGTNTGPMEGHPATGKKIDITGMDITRSKGGKLYEHWDYTDYISYFRQLGIDPFAGKPADSKKEEKKK